MIDEIQEKEIIGAFEAGGCPVDAFDFKAEIDHSLSIEENLSQLEEKTGFKPRPKLPKIDACAWDDEQKIAHLLARGYEMEIREAPGGKNQDKEPIMRMVFTKKNAASYAGVSACKMVAAPPKEVKTEPAQEAKEAPKVGNEGNKTPENALIYLENREITAPMVGKDGRLYNLYYYEDDLAWAVDCLQGKSKRFEGAYELVQACEFATYREAWLFFLDCMAGKCPDCETWKMPEEAN